MTVAQWKEKSHPVLARIITLEDRAQDCGLTEAERLEYDVLQKQWSRFLGELVKCDFSRENGCL